VFVRPDARGRGLGAAAVRALCARLRKKGLVPLYRAEEANAASCALARSLGFVRGYVMDGRTHYYINTILNLTRKKINIAAPMFKDC
jgi:L-amino acid N-acyltransferase YncA